MCKNGSEDQADDGPDSKQFPGVLKGKLDMFQMVVGAGGRD